MPIFRISLTLENAAFRTAEDGAEAETARILRRLADDIESRGFPVAGRGHGLRDVNGNRVGAYSIEE